LRRTSSDGRSIRLFLADGTPGGLLTAEIMNWTGHVVAAPRSDLAALLQRPETSRTGIYILLGDDPQSLGGTLAYIGEGDEVRIRLKQHARAEEQGGKDFWDRAIVLTSKDANLTKAHARFLESRFITLAQQARRSRLVNGTAPPPLPLPEADVSDMEYFIAQARIILPVLGVNILRSTAAAISRATESASASRGHLLTGLRAALEERRDYRDRPGDRRGVHRARGFQRPGGLDRRGARVQGLAREARPGRAIVPGHDGKTMRFARDQVFASPSAAAAVVVGRTANGRSDWKIKGSGVSFGDWQAQGIDQAPRDGLL
jgi:hypothetical protein